MATSVPGSTVVVVLVAVVLVVGVLVVGGVDVVVVVVVGVLVVVVVVDVEVLRRRRSASAAESAESPPPPPPPQAVRTKVLKRDRAAIWAWRRTSRRRAVPAWARMASVEAVNRESVIALSFERCCDMSQAGHAVLAWILRWVEASFGEWACRAVTNRVDPSPLGFGCDVLQGGTIRSADHGPREFVAVARDRCHGMTRRPQSLPARVSRRKFGFCYS